MLVVVLILALIVAVAAGLIAWSRGRVSTPVSPPQVGPKKEPCPDCGAEFLHGKDVVCKKCGRNLAGVAPSLRALPNVVDDADDDPNSRTVVGSTRAAQLMKACQSCGAALEGLSVCPKCGVRQG